MNDTNKSTMACAEITRQIIGSAIERADESIERLRAVLAGSVEGSQWSLDIIREIQLRMKSCMEYVDTEFQWLSQAVEQDEGEGDTEEEKGVCR